MSLELALALIGLLVSTFVAYHIAMRQGTFSRPKLFVTVGNHLLDPEFSRTQPWAVFLGIPNTDARLYVVELPIHLECGHQPVRKVLLQIGYPRGRHATSHVQLKPAESEQGDFFKRVHLPEWTLVEFGFDILRPKTKSA